MSREVLPVKPQPDLKLLATFLAVVRRGSMADAAAELGYVPSAVSQHIAGLERDMGVELIVRRPGSRLILTAAGRSLARPAAPWRGRPRRSSTRPPASRTPPTASRAVRSPNCASGSTRAR
ncbi:LysR family transcriptional regulator [Streptomyces chartreusis]